MTTAAFKRGDRVRVAVTDYEPHRGLIGTVTGPARFAGYVRVRFDNQQSYEKGKPWTVASLEQYTGDETQTDRRTYPLELTKAEAEAVAQAVQWAGHFATLAGDCQPGGPAFSTISEATAALERCGLPIYHSGATRVAVIKTAELLEERRAASAAAREAAA